MRVFRAELNRFGAGNEIDEKIFKIGCGVSQYVVKIKMQERKIWKYEGVVSLGGAEKKFSNPEKLKAGVEEFFEKLEAEQEEGRPRKIPLIEDLFHFLGISRETWEMFRGGGKSGKNRNFTEAVLMAEARFTAAIIQAAFENPKLITLAVYLTKQKCYGGYSDKNGAAVKETPTLTVKLEGAREPFG